jgi:hypothetical protein
MDQDPIAWAVHRHVVDASLSDLGSPPRRSAGDPGLRDPDWLDPDWLDADLECPVFVVAHRFGTLAR